MCASKISMWLNVCLAKEFGFFWAKLNTQDLKGLLRQKSHLLIPRTNYWGLLFSHESHPLRIHIAFAEHISLPRVALVGISYCGAVAYPAGLLLLACTGERKGGNYCSSQRCFALIKILTLRSDGPPQCWPCLCQVCTPGDPGQAQIFIPLFRYKENF